MQKQNTSDIKQKIIQILQKRGPSIPVQIAREIEMSLLFTSAFLAELLSEKKIKTSNLRVGSSPVYLLPGQEPQLENYSDNLKGKEKEAFMLLKEKGILKDSEQEPAIKVALRAIKDFAIPYEENEEIYWRYFTYKKENKPSETKQESQQQEIKKDIEQKDKEQKTQETEKKQPEDIFDKDSSEKTKEKTESKQPQEKSQKQSKTKSRKKTTKKKSTKNSKKDEKFFNKVKQYLSDNSYELLEIEGFDRNSVTLKIKKNSEEFLLIAYNKKRITEKEITDANKKASEKNLRYILLNLGEPTKKLSNFIDAIKNLETLEKLE